MARFFKLTNAVALAIFLAATIVDGFALVVRSTGTMRPGTTNAKTSRLHAAARRGKSSPLLEEAMSTYPFRFKSDSERAGMEMNFNEIARLYGDEEALAIVKLEPRSLRFRTEYFAPCLDAWTEQFGPEAARAMIGRNPGLLGIRPSEAEQPAEASMAFSYIVAATRPLPKILAAAGILAILTAGMR